MLTIRQVDNVVQNNLFIVKDWAHERQTQGETILYTVWTNAVSPKLYLGVFRIWEGIDGDARCGWIPLTKVAPEQEKLRDFFLLEIVIPILIGINNTVAVGTKTSKEKKQAEFDKLLPNKQKEYRCIGKIYRDMLRERDAEFKDSMSDELPNINAEALRDKLKDKISNKKIKFRLPQVRKLNTIIAMCKEGII